MSKANEIAKKILEECDDVHEYFSGVAIPKLKEARWIHSNMELFENWNKLFKFVPSILAYLSQVKN